MKITSIIRSAIVVFVLVFTSCLREESPPAHQYNPPDHVCDTKHHADAISWEINEDVATEAALVNNRPLFVYFYAQWCPFCKVMSENVLTDPRVVAEVNDNYVALKVDIDESELDDKIELNSIPTVAFVDIVKNTPISIIKGSTPAGTLLLELKTFAEQYKNNR